MFTKLRQNIVSLFRETLREWSDDHTSAVAASLAYYAIFALSPILIIMAVTVGTVIDRTTVESEIVGGVEAAVGDDVADTIDRLLDSNTAEATDVFGTLVWIAIVVWGSSGMFTQIQNALNKIWEVRPTPNRPLLAFIENRILSFSIVLTVNVFLLATLLINTGINILIRDFRELADVIFLIRPLQLLVSVTMMTILFAVVFKVLPNVHIRFQDVFVGALFTAVLFYAGQFAVGLYLASASVGSAFGAAGSLTVVLVWIYYSMQIFLFGAQFTEVWARHHGQYIQPTKKSGWLNKYKTKEELRRVGIYVDDDMNEITLPPDDAEGEVAGLPAIDQTTVETSPAEVGSPQTD